MKLKKVISVMLVGACVFSMAACGSKKEEAKKIESADDLKDAKIGVQTGTTGDIYCSDDFGDDHVERFNKGADAVQALVKGKIDAVVIDNEPAKAFVDANDGLKILETPYVSPEGVDRSKGKLVMATNAAFEPYEYYENDKIVGVDADFAQAIADKLGMELTINDMEFDSIIAAVDSGKADFGAAGMTVTDERKQQVDFSDSYYTGKQMIIVKK